jgi:hypothetical protein
MFRYIDYTYLLVVHLVNRDESTVALICGGGSGHEPSHAGFVGELTTIWGTPFLTHVRSIDRLGDGMLTGKLC